MSFLRVLSPLRRAETAEEYAEETTSQLVDILVRCYAVAIALDGNVQLPGQGNVIAMNDGHPTPHEHIVFTDFDGVEGILVDLNTKKYYQMNETAMFIWKGLEKGQSSLDIADQLAGSYEVTRESALQNVETAMRKFESYKLVGTK